MPFILSPEQMAATSKLLEDNASCIKYFDANTAMQVTAVTVIKKLIKGQKVLIHIPDNFRDTKNFNQIWEQSKLDHFSVYIDSTDSISQEEVAYLRILSHKVPIIQSMIEYRNAAKAAEKAKKTVLRKYEMLQSKIIHDRSVQDILDQSVIHSQNVSEKSEVSAQDLNIDLEFTPKEFYSVKKEISKLAERFQPQFDILDSIEIYSKSFFQTEDEKVLIELGQLYTELRVLTSDYQKTIASIYQELLNTETAKIQLAEQALESLEDDLFEYSLRIKFQGEQKKTGFRIFSGTKKDPHLKLEDIYLKFENYIRQASSEWDSSFQVIESSDLSVELLSSLIKKYQDEISDQLKLAEKKALALSLRTNKINTDHKELQDLDSRMTVIMDQLNTCGYFSDQFGNTILSAHKQEEYCTSVRSHVENAIKFVKTYKHYRSWKKDLIEGALSQNLRRTFKGIPTQHWIEIYQKWYVKKLYEQTIHSRESTTPEECLMLQKVANKLCIASLENERLLNQKVAVEKLRKGNKELYNTLFKKKQHPKTSWYDLALMNREFITTIYPISISNRISHASEYDLVLSFDQDQKEVDKIHYLSPITQEDVNSGPNEEMTFLYLNDFKDAKPLNSYNSIEKLRAAKKLTKFLLSLNHNVKLYQTKSANIISVLPPHDDVYFKETIQELGIKEIDTDNALYDRITESLLITERKPHLIIKNGLINSTLPDTMLWQSKVMHIMKKSGFEILSLDIEDLINDKHEAYENLKGKLPNPKANPSSELTDKPRSSPQNIELSVE